MNKVYMLITLEDPDPTLTRIFKDGLDAHLEAIRIHGSEGLGYKYIVVGRVVE